MGTPKRSPIARGSIKGIGNLSRKDQLTPRAQKETSERISRKARKLK